MSTAADGLGKMMPDRSRIALAAALDYARRGLRVFPVFEIEDDGRCACGRDCGRDAGKHPRTRHGFKDATTNSVQITAWWSRWPNANIGVATGEGIVVLDVDVHGER